MTYTTSRLRPLFASAMLAILACGGDTPSGIISVRYSIGATDDCAPLDIMTVRAEVGNDVQSAQADCDPSQPLVLDGIDAGNYPLLVTAIDSMGFIVMDNIGGLEDDDTVEVVGGSSREVDASLATTPATIGLKWILTVDGEGAECQFLATKTLRVTAFQNDGNTQMLTHDFDCVKPPGFAYVPDPNRVIDGQGLDTVQIRLFDDSDDELATAVEGPFEPPGPGRAVEITITCDEVNGMVTCTSESNIGMVDDPSAGSDGGSGGGSGGDSSG